MPTCERLVSPLRGRPAHHFVFREEAQDAFWNFAREWVRRAWAEDQEDTFSAFIHLWVVFNAWASVVVHDDEGGRESDTFLIAVLGHDPQLVSRFDCLLRTDPAFRQLNAEFAALWPVFEVRILRRLSIPAWDGTASTRRSYVDSVLPRLDQHLGEVSRRLHRGRRDPFYSPPCFRTHEHPPNDWPHTLRAVYMVRCNLFHGGKSFDRAGDQKFVDAAYRILRKAWEAEIPK